MHYAQDKGYHSRSVGAFNVTAIHDGALVRDRPAGFVVGIEEAKVESVFAAAGNDTGRFAVTFNPLLVETGTKNVLIDTGQGLSGPLGTGKTMSNLAAYGVAPEKIDIVLISHYHGDHIGGLLLPDGSPAYPNARVIVPGPEHAFWMAGDAPTALAGRMKQNKEVAERIFDALSGRYETIEWGDVVVPGIKAVEARGHSPGHTAYAITSGGESVLFAGDIVNNPIIFARFPDWVATFDNQPADMLATRHRLLNQLADNAALAYFFHARFPGFGHITRSKEGFDFHPMAKLST